MDDVKSVKLNITAMAGAAKPFTDHSEQGSAERLIPTPNICLH